MTESLCACGKPTRDDAYACDDCGDAMARALGDVPALESDLDLTLSRQRRFSSGANGSRAAETPLPYNAGASDAMGHLRAILVGWVRLCDEEGVRSSDYRDKFPANDLTSMSRWLMWRVDGLTRHEAATDAVDEITGAVNACHRVIDRPADRWFAGPCDQCGRDLYARQGAEKVACEACAIEYDVTARREWLLSSARDHHATASEIARAVIVWTDHDSGESRLTDRIRKWADRGRIDVKGHVEIHGRLRPLYQVGDVLDLLEQDARHAQDKIGTSGARS